MKLSEIVDEVFDIAIAIENNTISYFHPLLAVKKEQFPSDRLTAIAAPLKQKITNSMPLDKTELTVALKVLREIARDYKIKELRKPIKDLESYLDSLC